MPHRLSIQPFKLRSFHPNLSPPQSVLVTQSRLTLCESWTVPVSMGFSRQEYWSGLPFPSPGDLPDPGIESVSLVSPAGSLPLVPPGKPFNTHCLGSIRPKGKRARSSEQKMILGIVQLLT